MASRRWHPPCICLNSMPTKRRNTASARKRASTRKRTLKDPHGGLTAAGRAEFHRKDGSNLKPGVKKKLSEMTPAEMKRKGSWAVRFYGRRGKLPPLTDAQGKPTRYALSAAAWGEPVPKTIAAARAIAAKGRRLLERAKSASQRTAAANGG